MASLDTTQIGVFNPTTRDFAITSAILYHPDLNSFVENTKLSGNGQPSPFYMFVYHRDRMLAAIDCLPSTLHTLRDVISGKHGVEVMRTKAAQAADGKSMKLRFTMDCSGSLACTGAEIMAEEPRIQVQEYFPSSLPDPSHLAEDSVKWLVSVSSKATKVDFTTRHKTTLRSHYAEAFQEAPVVNARQRAEVLVYNEQGQVMEGCSTTPYFWRDNRWITPHADCGGNLGTTRRWAIEYGLATEGIIPKNEIRTGELLMLSNGVRGFGLGRIVVA